MQNAILRSLTTRQNAVPGVMGVVFGIAHNSQPASELACRHPAWADIWSSMHDEGGNCTVARPCLSGI
jgi:hypothetical protein